MDYRSRSRRYCHWRPLPASACSTPGRPLLFQALPEARPPRRTRSARRLQAGARGLPGRTAIRTVKRPHWSRRPAGAGANAVVRHRLLGACRIHSALGADHRESPCGRGAEGTPHGARPSEKGWDRSDCRCKAGCLELSRSITAPLRSHYGSFTAPSRLHRGSFSASLRFITPSVTPPCLQTPKSGWPV